MKASQPLLTDIGIGLAAGLVATRLTGPAQSMLYRLTPKAVRRREERVRSGSPTKIAATKMADAAGVHFDRSGIDRAATAIHYAVGVPWGLIYAFVRRSSGMTPTGAAFVTGASMSLIVDETLTPAMGFSAPSRDYPIATHARGFVAHLAFGAILAAAAETLYRLTKTTPPSERRLQSCR